MPKPFKIKYTVVSLDDFRVIDSSGNKPRVKLTAREAAKVWPQN